MVPKMHPTQQPLPTGGETPTNVVLYTTGECESNATIPTTNEAWCRKYIQPDNPEGSVTQHGARRVNAEPTGSETFAKHTPVHDRGM